MVEFNEYNIILETIRIVGFSSSVHHSQVDRLTQFLPEYMPPEFLQYYDSSCADKHKCCNDDSFRTDTFVEESNSWSIDVWSLGIIMLEIVHGFPIWMSD